MGKYITLNKKNCTQHTNLSYLPVVSDTEPELVHYARMKCSRTGDANEQAQPINTTLQLVSAHASRGLGGV